MLEGELVLDVLCSTKKIRPKILTQIFQKNLQIEIFLTWNKLSNIWKILRILVYCLKDLSINERYLLSHVDDGFGQDVN